MRFTFLKSRTHIGCHRIQTRTIIKCHDQCIYLRNLMASAMTVTIIAMIRRRGSTLPKIAPITIHGSLLSSSLLSSSAVPTWLPGPNNRPYNHKLMLFVGGGTRGAGGATAPQISKYILSAPPDFKTRN